MLKICTKKLEEKAKQSDIINENELINGIVYEGGIDYCTYDVDGGCIDYCDNNNDVDMVEVDVKKMKKKINEKRSLYTKEGYYLCDSIRHSDISWGNYYTVPDAGLAMITQEYIKDINKRKYGCTLVSAAGIINWMDRKNGSVLKTYDTLYNVSA